MTKEILSKILSSASKLVLLLFSGAIVAGLFTGHVTEETFKIAVLMVLTYYFTNKGDPAQPYGGK
jgi:hypothetical protein